ncbi:hypothetical protein ACS0TY_004720 [Phlomoides rotata]
METCHLNINELPILFVQQSGDYRIQYVLDTGSLSREVNCCHWKGVVCSNVTRNVHQLHLHGSLDVSGNSLTGEIPSNLGNLSNLVTSGLSDNNLTGRPPG